MKPLCDFTAVALVVSNLQISRWFGSTYAKVRLKTKGVFGVTYFDVLGFGPDTVQSMALTLQRGSTVLINCTLDNSKVKRNEKNKVRLVFVYRDAEVLRKPTKPHAIRKEDVLDILSDIDPTEVVGPSIRELLEEKHDK